MASVTVSVQAPGYGITQRKDRWWVEPLVQGTLFLILAGYSTWAAFQGEHYEFGPYLSPMYSPLLQPSWWPLSPAILILWVPIGFRATCYYYRKMYYRSFFLDPPACTVEEPRNAYRGESAFPFILQNMHRYLLYLGFIPLATMWYDVYLGTKFEDGFGIGVGTLVLFVNVAAISLYVFSCHAFRHVIGGNVDCFAKATCGKQRHAVWKASSRSNEHHMMFAWISFFAVVAADLYVRLGSMGYLTDIRII
ncbi:MAG: succinate dehydrogenase [Nitrospirae bacterium]|nr:succinate dehydrogenase [Nitrospirota bacterium]